MASMYELTVPVLVRGLETLTRYLDRAAVFAHDRGIAPSALLEARLAADMLPLSGQIQRASDTAKNGVARLIGAEAPRFADDERTIAQLKERLARTAAYVGGVPPGDFDGAAARHVSLPFRSSTTTMDGHAYLTQFMLPNFYFHVAMTHGILRHCGLDIGKLDYLGGF